MNNLNIISVDDNTVNLMLIESLAEVIGYKVHSFENPLKALEYVNHKGVDLAFIDYMMPDMDGISLIKEIRKINETAPLVIVTAVSDNKEIKINALSAGATEFLTKPLDSIEFHARFKNLVNLRLAQLKIENKSLLLEDEIKKATKVIKNRELEALSLLARAAEYKDKETGNHILRVAKYSQIIAKNIGESDTFQQIILAASPLHDIGKIGIADSILNKPGKLTEEEMNEMQKHPFIGFKILNNAKSPYVKMGAEISLHHHEKFNGTGYPDKLVGENIPLSSRIVAVADVFDALTSKRPYKKPWELNRAFDYLLSEKNKHFDPKLVDAFLKDKEVIIETYNNLKDF